MFGFEITLASFVLFGSSATSKFWIWGSGMVNWLSLFIKLQLGSRLFTICSYQITCSIEQGASELYTNRKELSKCKAKVYLDIH